MKTRVLVPALAIWLSVALAACGGDSADTEATGDPTPSDPPSSAESSAPVPAPDLEGRLMFSRFAESTHTFISTHIAEPDGSNETELPLPGPEGGGRWSRSGKEIAVMTVLPDERIGTAIISPEGTVDRVLEIPDESLNLPCTVWSPDDSRLACEGWDDKDPSRRGLYTVRASDGGDLRRLTKPPKGLGDLPGDFSPDGKQFVFKRAADEEPGPLMIVDVADGSLRRLTEEPYEDAGRFSPDGKSILSAAGAIVVMDLKGKPVQSIGKPGFFLFGPVWSPDGKWVAFSGSESGYVADIFITRPDGSDEIQVTSTDDNEIVVEWGAD